LKLAVQPSSLWSQYISSSLTRSRAKRIGGGGN
jgi:hypothetical protein